MENSKEIQILLVEDSNTDAELAIEALGEGLANSVHHVRDGVEAMAFLNQESPYESAPRPDIVLLDLNMPRMNGKQVLTEIKKAADLKTIPVVVLTTSSSDKDVFESYGLNALAGEQ